MRPLIGKLIVINGEQDNIIDIRNHTVDGEEVFDIVCRNHTIINCRIISVGDDVSSNRASTFELSFKYDYWVKEE